VSTDATPQHQMAWRNDTVPNGVGRAGVLRDLFGDPNSTRGSIGWRQAVGGGLVFLGMVAILLGWWGMSGTTDVVDQFSFLMSGGIVGAALIAIGATLWISHEHDRDRIALGLLYDRLEAMEQRLASQIEELDARVTTKGTRAKVSPTSPTSPAEQRARR
jgi:hypothetical protein